MPDNELIAFRLDAVTKQRDKAMNGEAEALAYLGFVNTQLHAVLAESAEKDKAIAVRDERISHLEQQIAAAPKRKAKA